MEEIEEVVLASGSGSIVELNVTDSVLVLFIIDDGLSAAAGATLVDIGFLIELNIDVPVSDVVLPRFLFAKSYMSPNIPANVFLKFFIVSSASSATDVCDCGGRGPPAAAAAPAAGRDVEDTPDTVDD